LGVLLEQQQQQQQPLPWTGVVLGIIAREKKKTTTKTTLRQNDKSLKRDKKKYVVWKWLFTPVSSADGREHRPAQPALDEPARRW